MSMESTLNQSQHNTDDKSVPNEQFTPDKKTLCLRLEHGIPLQLAMAVPAGMEILEGGTSFDGHPMYMVCEVLACGTAEDVLEYIMDDYLICGPGLDAEIIKVGEGIGGSLYILRQYTYSGTVEDIMDCFKC